MNLENQVCSVEQSKTLKQLGVVQKSVFYHHPAFVRPVIGDTLIPNGVQVCNDKTFSESAYTASELFKMLPFRIYHEGDDYFMSFGHGNEGYRVIYETNKLGLEFNLDGDLDRTKKALFKTSRSGKTAARVLAEYLRMLIECGENIVPLNEINNRLVNN